MAKSVQKIESRKLRRQSFSINEIAKKVGFSKRTISRWCRDIELNKKQRDVLWAKSKVKYTKNFRAYCERKKDKTKEKIKRLKNEGIKRVGNLSKRELFIAGAALYWAEGFKKDSRIGFANSDPAMIRFFIKWLKDCLNINIKEITVNVALNISHKNRLKEIENYWSEKIKISKLQFKKPFFQKTKWKKQYEHPNRYYGLLRVRVVKSLDQLRVIHGYINGLRQNV